MVEEELQSTISSSISLQINKGTYGVYEESGERTRLTEYIDNTLDLAAQRATAGTDNRVRIDNTGITLENTTDDSRQIRLLNDLIVVTSDGFETADVAISPSGCIREKIFGSFLKMDGDVVC